MLEVRHLRTLIALAEAGTVSVRHQSKGDLGPRPLAEFLTDLHKEINSRIS